jgi:pyruvate kinase
MDDLAFFDTPASSKHRKTKIVATVGPACRSPEIMREMIKAGANVFRLNFSHGSHAEHLESLNTIRAVSAELGIPVAVLQDLSGPKIRISKVDENYVEMRDGGTVTLHPAAGELSTGSDIYVEGLNPLEIVKPKDQVLMADGAIYLTVEAVEASGVRCKVIKGGRLRSRVGIAFPDSVNELPAATPKDFEDLVFGIKHQVDYVAISFVQNARDILVLREAMRKDGANCSIIAKIERKSALRNIKEIMDVSDGIMVARGDLGLELPLEMLPRVQRGLIEEGNYRGIPVIVATQMMHSMITAVRPTRAEVSDIAAAVMSGADAVMLSEETTIGEHPVECVRYIDRIVREAEKGFEFEEYKLRLRDSDRATVPDAVAYAACAAGNKVGASAIVACTTTGTSARLVAKYRPQQPLYGASRIEATLRRMALYWGVQPIPLTQSASHDEEIDGALNAVQNLENLPNGTRCVVIGGSAVGRPGSTSILEIRELLGR